MSYGGYSEFEDFASTSSNSNTVDPQLLKLLRDVQENVQHFCNNVNTIERKIDQLRNVGDTPASRAEIVQLVADTAQLAKIANGPIQKLRLQSRQLSNGDRNHFERIMTNFSSAGIKYRQLQQVAQDLEREMVNQSRQARQRSSSTYSDTDTPSSNPFGEEEQLSHHDEHANSHDQMILQQQLEDDGNLLEEREQHMRQLEGDIIDINDIFRDLGTMVHDQGETIDNIEANVEFAATRVEKGNKQLGRAVQHKRCSRKLTLAILCVVLTVVIAIIIGILILLGVLNVYTKH